METDRHEERYATHLKGVRNEVVTILGELYPKWASTSVIYTRSRRANNINEVTGVLSVLVKHKEVKPSLHPGKPDYMLTKAPKDKMIAGEQEVLKLNGGSSGATGVPAKIEAPERGLTKNELVLKAIRATNGILSVDLVKEFGASAYMSLQGLKNKGLIESAFVEGSNRKIWSAVHGPEAGIPLSKPAAQKDAFNEQRTARALLFIEKAGEVTAKDLANEFGSMSTLIIRTLRKSGHIENHRSEGDKKMWRLVPGKDFDVIGDKTVEIIPKSEQLQLSAQVLQTIEEAGEISFLDLTKKFGDYPSEATAALSASGLIVYGTVGGMLVWRLAGDTGKKSGENKADQVTGKTWDPAAAKVPGSDQVKPEPLKEAPIARREPVDITVELVTEAEFRKRVNSERLRDVIKAIDSRFEHGKQIPAEWIDELKRRAADL